jgi:hypothetical protein
MLASISPVGEASRRQRWALTVPAYVVGSAVGGALVGLVAGVVGRLVSALTGPPATALLVALLAVAGLVAAAVDVGAVRVRLPSWQRQVDERWLTTYRGWVYGAGFGFQLGAGVLTRIPTAATHLWLLAAVATTSPAAGAVIGTTFGTVRALPLLLTRPLDDPTRLNRFHARMEDGALVAQRGASAAVLLTVVAAVAAVIV